MKLLKNLLLYVIIYDSGIALFFLGRVVDYLSERYALQKMDFQMEQCNDGELYLNIR